MPPKKKGGSGGHNFGRALIKDRFGRGNKTLNQDSFVRDTMFTLIHRGHRFVVVFLPDIRPLSIHVALIVLFYYAASHFRIGRWIRLGKIEFTVCH